MLTPVCHACHASCRIVGPLFSPINPVFERASKHLLPMIEERLKKEAEYGKDWAERPVYIFVAQPILKFDLGISRTIYSLGCLTRLQTIERRCATWQSEFSSSISEPFTPALSYVFHLSWDPRPLTHGYLTGLHACFISSCWISWICATYARRSWNRHQWRRMDERCPGEDEEDR